MKLKNIITFITAICCFASLVSCGESNDNDSHREVSLKSKDNNSIINNEDTASSELTITEDEDTVPSEFTNPIDMYIKSLCIGDIKMLFESEYPDSYVNEFLKINANVNGMSIDEYCDYVKDNASNATYEIKYLSKTKMTSSEINDAQNVYDNAINDANRNGASFDKLTVKEGYKIKINRIIKFEDNPGDDTFDGYVYSISFDGYSGWYCCDAVYYNTYS